MYYIINLFKYTMYNVGCSQVYSMLCFQLADTRILSKRKMIASYKEL